MKKGFNFMAVILLSAAFVPAHAGEGSKEVGRSREKEKSAAKRSDDASRRDSRVLRVGPSTTYLKNGLSLDEVVRLLGQPVSRSERREGASRLTTCIFARSEGRILLAEFENGVLVSSRTEIRPATIAEN